MKGVREMLPDKMWRVCPKCGELLDIDDTQYECCIRVKMKPAEDREKLNALRKEAHDAFDEIWKSGWVSRQQAYEWLGRRMKLPPEMTHISLMGAEQCEQVIELCTDWRRRIAGNDNCFVGTMPV